MNGGIPMSDPCSLLSIHFTFSVIDIPLTMFGQTRHLAAKASVTVFFKHHCDQTHLHLFDSVVLGHRRPRSSGLLTTQCTQVPCAL
jgi:hypothetical protein